MPLRVDGDALDVKYSQRPIEKWYGAVSENLAQTLSHRCAGWSRDTSSASRDRAPGKLSSVEMWKWRRISARWSTRCAAWCAPVAAGGEDLLHSKDLPGF